MAGTPPGRFVNPSAHKAHVLRNKSLPLLSLISLLGLALLFLLYRNAPESINPIMSPENRATIEDSIVPLTTEADFDQARASQSSNEALRASPSFITGLQDQFGLPKDIQEVKRPKVNLEDKPIFQRLAELENSAESGDVEAALEIALGIARCSHVVTSGESLEDRLSNLYSTRTPHRGLPMVENIEEYERLFRSEHTYCQSLNSDHIATHYRYMLVAAELGSTFAQSNLISLIGVPEDMRKIAERKVWDSAGHMEADRLQHIRTAARNGDVEAMNLVWRDPTLSAEDSIAYRIAGLYLDALTGQVREGFFEWEMQNIRNEHYGFDEDLISEKVRSLLEADACCRVFTD